jgi:hypothetical protein
MICCSRSPSRPGGWSAGSFFELGWARTHRISSPSSIYRCFCQRAPFATSVDGTETVWWIGIASISGADRRALATQACLMIQTRRAMRERCPYDSIEKFRGSALISPPLSPPHESNHMPAENAEWPIPIVRHLLLRRPQLLRPGLHRPK